METIKYYFITEQNKEFENQSLIGKHGHYLRDCDFDWWGIKEYGFLKLSIAKAIATKYNKTRDYANYGIKEIQIKFDTQEDKTYFINRFIKMYK